jgi:type I restriction enzyme S subunit
VFLKLRLKAPDATEQRAIAAVLETADTELRLLRQQRNTLDQQRRWLMQQLLTGKLRVKAA